MKIEIIFKTNLKHIPYESILQAGTRNMLSL